MMNEDEVYEMQSKIDEGIFLAQKRLVERARHNHTTLVVARGGQIVEVSADELYPVRRNYCSLFSK
ncbi:MAG: hypothetical protein LUC45_03110 [Paraprevotella sp.]|nr:hypothetical protein [Paraprevotella sp.]